MRKAISEQYKQRMIRVLVAATAILIFAAGPAGGSALPEPPGYVYLQDDATAANPPAAVDAGTQDSVTNTSAGSTPLAGLVLKPFADPLSRSMASAARKYIQSRSDVELSLIHAPAAAAGVAPGPAAEAQLLAQAAAIDELTVKGVLVLALNPVTPTQVRPAEQAGLRTASAGSRELAAAVKRALDSGVTVVTFAEPLPEQAALEAGLPADLPFVGPDYTLGASLVVEQLAAHLQPGSAVLLLAGADGAEGAYVLAQRKQGLVQMLNKAGLKIAASSQVENNIEQAGTVSLALLKKYKESQAVLTVSDLMAQGAVLAVEELKRNVFITGYGATPEGLTLVQDGRLLVTVDDHGSDLAVKALEAAFAKRSGALAPGWVKTPVQAVTKTGILVPDTETIRPLEPEDY